MTCNKCGEKPKKGCGAFPKAVIEIDNPERIVLLRKVLVPASMGDESTFPPTIGKYHNVLLEYEASGGIYLYSSDGIPTKLSSDVTELQAQLNALRVRIGEEEVARADADTALSDRITSLDDSLATVAKTGSYNDLSDKPTIGNGTLTIKKNGSNVGTFTANATANTDVNIAVPTKTSDLANDGSDGASQYVESNDLATVAASGSYNDLTNKPTIGNATLTIKRNNANAGTFTANATTNKSINIAVPTKTSDLTNDGADGTSTYVEADDLPTVDTTYSPSSNNAIANSTVTNSLDRNVMTNLAVDSTPSTTTVNLNNTKTNLAYPSSSTTSSISLPVASSTQAGVMNSATFDAVTSNTNNINAILNGAVAISNLPASPTQAQLTTAWENETGLTSLINRASVYDVANNKVWTYYTNDQTWHAASNTSQVTVNTFTNSSEGTIKGSTNDGQVFAENDGTGSVNGWDALTSTVSSNTSKLATIAQGAEVNVQANWTQTNTSADDYIKNKPANLVQDASYVHTDNNFTTTLKNKLDGIESGAEVNVQADWSQTDTSADDYIKNKPTIPTVNNATLTIQKNGTNVQTFTANSSTNKTANITVPTAVSELTNDSGYATTTQLNSGLATKQDTLTAGDNIQINGNTISATDTTYTAGNAIDITNGEISADIHPADFFTAEDTVSDCGRGLSLDDTMASTLKSVELRGDTFQQTYSGEQLLTKNGMATPLTDTTFWNQVATGTISYTPLSDGWARVVQNSSGFGNIMVRNTGVEGFSTGTTYTVIFEMRNVSGAGTTFGESKSYDIAQPSSTNDPWEGSTFRIIEGARWRGGTNIYIPLQDAQTPQYAVFVGTTKSSSTGYSLRTFTRSTVPVGTTFDIRATVLLGDHSSDWRNYCGENWQPFVGGTAAPNPEYPQDIHVVTGEQTVTVSGKNLCSGSQKISDNAMQLLFANQSTCPQTFTISFVSPANAQNVAVIVYYALGSSTGTIGRVQLTEGERASATITLTDAQWESLKSGTDGWVQLYLSGAWAQIDHGVDEPQIEQGSTATAYEPYQPQSYTISLGSLELCKIGDYQDYIYKSGDDWYLHKAMGKITLDGSETWTAAQMTNNWMYYTINAGMATVTSSQVPKIVSNYFGVTTTDGQWTSVAGSKSVTLNNTASPNTQIRFTVGDSTNKLADFKTWLSSHNTTVYYALATAANIQIENPVLVAQLDALAKARSYNDQTNIIVTTAGENLPATLCVEAYRKSLEGVIEAIDNACTCRKNLVVYLPNGMTTYENNDAPIPIPEVLEALERGQSVFLVGGGLSWNVYTVTAANAEDGIWTMRADQTGINSGISDGHWHISGRDNLWRTVEFVPDTEQDSVINLSVVVDDSSWDEPFGDYKVLNILGVETTIGHCKLSAAQGNAGLFVNDDTGEFVTIGEAYELIASGARVQFNNVPVGQYLASPHTYSPSGEDVFSGIELPVKYFFNNDGAYVTEYTNSVVLPHLKFVPPLAVSIEKIDQGDILEYEFIIQGIMPSSTID